MPNYNEGTPRDPTVPKQFEQLYRGSSAPESFTNAATRNKLEQSFKAEPSARPDPVINKQPFTENLHSVTQPKGFEDFATKARETARQEFNALQNQAKESVLGTSSKQINAKNSTKTSTIEPNTVQLRNTLENSLNTANQSQRKNQPSRPSRISLNR